MLLILQNSGAVLVQEHRKLPVTVVWRPRGAQCTASWEAMSLAVPSTLLARLWGSFLAFRLCVAAESGNTGNISRRPLGRLQMRRELFFSPCPAFLAQHHRADPGDAGFPEEMNHRKYCEVTSGVRAVTQKSQ